MSDWRRADPDHPGRLVPWALARAGWHARDFNLGDAPIRFAQAELSSQLPACPGCGARPDAQAWVCIERGDEVGWLTICDPCVRQVGYVTDPIATALAREGNR